LKNCSAKILILENMELLDDLGKIEEEMSQLESFLELFYCFFYPITAEDRHYSLDKILEISEADNLECLMEAKKRNQIRFMLFDQLQGRIKRYSNQRC